MDSPFRCLDEFDVFMDAVNRKKSIQQIVRFSDKHPTQYVLITPQDMSVIPTDRPNVRVVRMADPERR